MAIDKIFKSSNVDDLADNILSEVDDFMVSVDKMQQRKVAGNVQKVIQAFKQIETDLQDRYDNVTNVIEKRVLTIKDGRDGSSGSDGRNGRDGKPGRDGVNGKQGTPGAPGKDGVDGVDGVSVTDASIDFDGSLVISLSTGQQINVGEVVPPELERQLVELRQGGSAGSSGDVAGPTASTDNAIVRFDGTTGKLVQNSVVTIADTTGNMAGVGTLGVGAITTTGALVGTATQNAFNTVSTTLNLGGAATAVNVGAATGTLTVANTTLAAKAITASTTLGVTGVSTLTGGAVVQGLTVGLGAGAVAGNTAVGASALAANTTGSENTAVGYQAGYSNTIGRFNFYAGYQTGYINTVGFRNSFSGVYSGYYATGNDNTGHGYLALSSITIGASGSFNTALGSAALANNTTASNNTAVGYQAGYTNTTGQNLVAIGYQAGYTSNANNSTYVGYYAGQGTTGTLNTFVGVNGVGYLVSSGTRNTIIGGYSGNQGGLDIRTASNYIVLSDGDGNPLISTADNQTVALEGAVPNSGAGITFPATQSASTDPNTLDDYEEGTWTPAQGSGLTVVGAFSSNGSYVKIGNVVTVRFQLQGATSIATGAAGTEITSNLPFSAGVVYASGTFTGTSNIGYTVFNTYNSAAYSPGSITGNAQLVFSITYITS